MNNANLAAAARWLIIFDNADASSPLDALMPASAFGCVLITTREHSDVSISSFIPIQVRDFELDAAVTCLLRLTSLRSVEANEAQAARVLVEKIGGLPLTLAQMAALVNTKSSTIQQLGLFYSKQQHGQDCGIAKQETPLEIILRLSFADLGPDAKQVLSHMCFLSPDSIPQEILMRCTSFRVDTDRYIWFFQHSQASC